VTLAPKSPLSRILDQCRQYAVPAIAAMVLLAGGFGIYRVVSGETPRKRVLETVAIKLVPPSPPKVEPPPEPPKMVEEQKIEPPVDKPMDSPKDEPPPGPLALDAKGEAGSDSFGLGGKQGGADFLGSGGGGTRFGHYAVLISGIIQKLVQQDAKLGDGKFTVKIWVADSGRVQHVQVLHNSGDPSINTRVEEVIGAVAFPEAPPKDMPPMIVRVEQRPGLG
jgi:periplasmic protein TonB